MKELGCLFILILIAFTFLSGYIFMLLWNWITPLFWNGSPVLDIWTSMGTMFLLQIIANFFRKQITKN